MAAPPTRWGILGTGLIAGDFVACLRSMPDSEHQVVAVAARNKDRAEEFAAKFGIKRVHASYQDLMDDPEIDVVYVSTIHISHVELSLGSISAGKSVLCEKPMSLSFEGCKKVLSAAKEKNVLFVEGTWSRFFPATQYIKETLAAGDIGEIKSVQATFCIPIFGKDRISKRELGGGGLMDIGCYTVQAVNQVFKGRPESITVQGTFNDQGVDKAAVIVLQYPGDKLATLTYDAEASGGASSFVIRGTKGNLVVPDSLWCPDRVVKQDGQFFMGKYQAPPRTEVQDGEVKFFPVPVLEREKDISLLNSQGFVYEIQGVRDCLVKGLKESPNMPHEDSETIMYILTEVQKKLGISYDFL